MLEISPVQVALNQKNAQELGFKHGVEAWLTEDMCSMPMLQDVRTIIVSLSFLLLR